MMKLWCKLRRRQNDEARYRVRTPCSAFQREGVHDAVVHTGNKNGPCLLLAGMSSNGFVCVGRTSRFEFIILHTGIDTDPGTWPGWWPPPVIILICHHYPVLPPRARTIITTTELRDDRHQLQQRQQQQLEEEEATSAVDLVLCFVYPKNVIWLWLLCRLPTKRKKHTLRQWSVKHSPRRLRRPTTTCSCAIVVVVVRMLFIAMGLCLDTQQYGRFILNDELCTGHHRFLTIPATNTTGEPSQQYCPQLKYGRFEETSASTGTTSSR